MSTAVIEAGLPFWKKVAYGTGDWSTASLGTLRQVFYAIFLTDVVGLEPRLASLVALVGILWDAVNDPLVGMLSDRVRTRWGRRRPFLLWFAIPYGASFTLLWWAPPIQNQVLLAAVVCLAFMLADTLQTLVSVPFMAMLPEIAPSYDERTTLTGYRIFFNLLASLATAVAAPIIIDATLAAGATQQQGYLLVAALFGGLSALPFLLIFLTIHEPARGEAARRVSLKTAVRTTWANIPFRFASILYMLNWITFDLIGLALPFYLTYWIAGGNLLQTALGLPLESTVFALILTTSVLVLPFWTWLAHKLSKRSAYIVGMAFWAVVQLLIFGVQPGQMTMVLVLSVLAGISVSTAHVLPDAMFPDVIEWDELRTRRRQEGIYYGVMSFIRKVAGALAIFIALQVLGWVGYQTPPPGVTTFSQPAATVLTIRFLIGPFGAVLLFSAILFAWFYPLTREKHGRIRRLLDQRKQKQFAHGE
ncbi:MAG: MFS transporter [Anaerolineales bacterium]|nr:MFS transporter [Anaerolineales bacterium]